MRAGQIPMESVKGERIPVACPIVSSMTLWPAGGRNRLSVVGSFGRQRVPMLDASTLDDRTRPVVAPTGWMARRLRILRRPRWTERPDGSVVHRVAPVDPRSWYH
jgi:hypothetical protein